MGQHLFLTGFMGSGKSTVCPLLADRLGRTCTDLDSWIEKGEGATIPTIFESRGESGFRAVESRYLKLTADWEPTVIALGGGAFAVETNRDFIRRHGISVWLKVSLEVASERSFGSSHRPLAQDPSGWQTLFEARRRFYELADVHIDTAGNSPPTICDEILEALGKMGFPGR